MAGDPQKERVQALDMAFSQIDKQFGKGSIFRLGDNTVRRTAEVIPSGILGLDN